MEIIIGHAQRNILTFASKTRSSLFIRRSISSLSTNSNKTTRIRTQYSNTQNPPLTLKALETKPQSQKRIKLFNPTKLKTSSSKPVKTDLKTESLPSSKPVKKDLKTPKSQNSAKTDLKTPKLQNSAKTDLKTPKSLNSAKTDLKTPESLTSTKTDLKTESLTSAKTALKIDTSLFSVKSFSDLNLPPALLSQLETCNFQTPTEVQSTAIPTISQNYDVIIQSYTGSGKTLAYLLPILSQVGPLKQNQENQENQDYDKKQGIEAVIVAPSRELGMQIVREVEKLLGPTHRKLVQQLVGGANRHRQEENLKKNKPLIVVGTPGRIAEISALGKLQTHSCRFLVLDEVDQLLSFNYREDMHRIIEHVGRKKTKKTNDVIGPLVRRSERQTIMVSATVPFSVIRAAISWAFEPVLVRGKTVTSLESMKPETGPTSESLPPSLDHYYSVSKGQHKVDLLRKCVHALNAQSVIVFMNNTRPIKDVVYKLEARGMDAAELHGDLNKLTRSTIMKRFKEGKVRVLVTNELSARGLDVPECDLVVNFDLPTDSTHYAHRAGRTGRLGRKGCVVSVCEEREVFVVKKLRKQLGVGIKPCEFRDGEIVVRKEEDVE